MPSPGVGPEHWHERARQARSVAQWVSDPDAKRLLLEVAERYEEIAALAEAGRIGFVIPSQGS